ncbi:MAG: IS66 family insertion sequence element accessory protein TnpA [Bacteroidota bacterium]
MQKAKKQPEDRIIWEKRFNEFQASGKTQAAWCKEKNINPNTFNFWYLRLKREKTQPEKQTKKSVKWLAIDTKKIGINPETNIVATPRQAIDIKIANMTIEVKPGFKPEHLLNIVKTLSKLC